MFGCVWHNTSYKASHDLISHGVWDPGRLRCLPGYQGLARNIGLRIARGSGARLGALEFFSLVRLVDQALRACSTLPYI
jgi:hypothetical protein